MTVLNFPSTAGKPTDGSFQYIANGVVYSWDGEKWVSNTQANGGGGGRSEPVHFDGPDAPDFDSLIAGDQWYNTNDGRLYTYTLNDNNVLVWVDASPDSSIPLWERTGTTLAPTNDGDDVDLGTGDLSAATANLSSSLKVDGDTWSEIKRNTSTATDNLLRLISDVDAADTRVIQVNADGELRIGGTLPSSPNITLSAAGIGRFNQGALIGFPTGEPASMTGVLQVKGSVVCNNLGSGAGTNTLKYNTSTGRITYDTSSARYKDNIRDSDVGLAEVMQLRSAKFEYKEGGRTDIGFIAEEVAPIIPTLVGVNEDDEPDSVSYDRMVSVLTKALQEAVTRIEALEAKVQQLEGGTN